MQLLDVTLTPEARQYYLINILRAKLVEGRLYYNEKDITDRFYTLESIIEEATDESYNQGCFDTSYSNSLI